MHKILRIIVCIALCFVILLTSVSALNTSSLSTEISNQYLNELVKINKDIMPQNPYTLENSVPVYMFESVSGGENDKSFGSHVSESFILETDGDSWRKSYYKDNGVWKESGSASVPTYYDKDGNVININFNMHWFIEQAEGKFDGNISELKVVYYEYKYMIYFVSEGIEYVIPYDVRSDLSGIKNGNIYKANDLIEIIFPSTDNQVQSISKGEDPTIYGGTISDQTTDSENTTTGAKLEKTDAQTQIAEPETITTGSNVETLTPKPLDVEDDDLQKTDFPYWIIGVIVGVTAIAAVTVIVIKKKKA